MFQYARYVRISLLLYWVTPYKKETKEIKLQVKKKRQEKDRERQRWKSRLENWIKYTTRGTWHQPRASKNSSSELSMDSWVMLRIHQWEALCLRKVTAGKKTEKWLCAQANKEEDCIVNIQHNTTSMNLSNFMVGQTDNADWNSAFKRKQKYLIKM